MNNTVLVIITALFSGLVATLVTIWWQSKSQKKTDKRRIFTILMSKRYDIAAEESVEALNMIDVFFYKSKKVREVWKEFNDATNAPNATINGQSISDKHLRLLEVIAEDIGYKKIKWEDIKQYYFPTGLSDIKRDEAVLRKVQIDAALTQINSEKEHNNVAQIDKNTELSNQMLLKLMDNPDGLLKVLEVAEKVQKFSK